jgi:serine/threonine protein kinase
VVVAVKIRGIAESEVISDDFFIVIDRLCEILDSRMELWSMQMKKVQKVTLFGPSSKNKQLLQDLLVGRLTVAYDLAAAFRYLHENMIVYRDIKPANIGFDHRGTFKNSTIQYRQSSPSFSLSLPMSNSHHTATMQQEMLKCLILDCVKPCHRH